MGYTLRHYAMENPYSDGRGHPLYQSGADRSVHDHGSVRAVSHQPEDGLHVSQALGRVWELREPSAESAAGSGQGGGEGAGPSGPAPRAQRRPVPAPLQPFGWPGNRAGPALPEAARASGPPPPRPPWPSAVSRPRWALAIPRHALGRRRLTRVVCQSAREDTVPPPQTRPPAEALRR